MSHPDCRQHTGLGDGPSIRRQLASSSAVLSAAVIAVSGANYLLNVVLARALTPSEFGDAALIVTLMLVLTAVAVTLQLCTAREVVLNPQSTDATRASLGQRATSLGAWIGFTLFVTSPALKLLFNTDSFLPFAVLALSIPWYLRQSVDRGILQGQQRFVGLAGTFVLEGAVRLGAGLFLLSVGVGSLTAAISLSASFGATALLSTILVKPRRSASHTSRGLATTRTVDAIGAEPTDGHRHEAGSQGTPRYVKDLACAAQETVSTHHQAQSTTPIAAAATTLLIGQVLINNGDILLAKFAFEPEQAGLYASVALIGRAIFFASWAIANAAFPLIADPALSPIARRRIRSAATTAVAAFGFGAAALMVPLGPTICRLLFGASYAGTGDLLAPYALATALFAVANLLATLDVAIGKAFSAVLVLCAAVWQTVVLGVFASSPRSMILLQIMLMGILTILLGGFHFVRDLRQRNYPLAGELSQEGARAR